MSKEKAPEMGAHIKIEACEVQLKTLAEGHTFRELTLIGFSLQAASDALRQSVVQVAPYYHDLAVKIETSVRKDAKPGTSEQAIMKEALDTFQGFLDGEIEYLRKEKGWQSNKLPDVADSAVRKITAAMEMGFSLVSDCQTVSQCEKAVTKARKEMRKAKADAAAAALGMGADAQALDTGAGDSLTLPGGVDLTDEHREAMADFVKAFHAALQNRASEAIESLKASTRKMENIAKLNARSITGAVTQASAAAH